MPFVPDPSRDLVLVRTADVAPAFVWDAWTQPELLKRWFCPLPWRTVEAEIDARPGGIFRTVMRGPDGQEFANTGCFLEVVPRTRLVWTGALGPDFRPQVIGPDVPFVMTAIITMEADGDACRYTATVLHGDEDGRGRHATMGFEQGWSAAFDQLVAMAPKG